MVLTDARQERFQDVQVGAKQQRRESGRIMNSKRLDTYKRSVANSGLASLAAITSLHYSLPFRFS